MEFWEHLQALGVDNLHWGLKESFVDTDTPTSTETDFDDWRIIEHYKELCPAQTQLLDSCESEATTNLIEWWVWKRTGKKVSLDASIVYKHARKLLYDGKLPGGLCVGDSSKALIDMGIIPSTTKIIKLPPRGDLILKMLEFSPIVTGHRVWDGWFPRNVNPDNGCIDESEDGKYNMGHATLLVGTNIHNGIKLFVHLNSWGAYPPMRGLFAMSCHYSIYNMLGGGLLLDIPTGWENGEPWKPLIMAHPK